MDQIISFPGLGLEFHFNTVAFSVFGKPIYWYGIIIGCGFLLAVFYASRRAKEFDLNSDLLLDMLLFATPIAIICARLYYVAFEWETYKNNPAEIIAVWHGGIAVYGSIIGAIATVIVFCRYRKVNVFDMMDIGSLGLLIGQFIGRWGNFANGEAFGGPTTLPWRMNIGKTIAESGDIGVQPTFFYESFWNFCGFILIHFYSKKRRYHGEVFLMYVAWYGLGRFFIEGMRTDSLYIMGTGIRVSQVLAILSSILACGILIYNHKVKPILKPVCDGETNMSSEIIKENNAEE